MDNIVHGQAETTAFDSTAANELGVVQSKPYFAVDQLMAEINGESAEAEAEEAVESETTEPVAEPEVAEEAEPVVVSFNVLIFLLHSFLQIKLKQTAKR